MSVAFLHNGQCCTQHQAREALAAGLAKGHDPDALRSIWLAALRPDGEEQRDLVAEINSEVEVFA